MIEVCLGIQPFPQPSPKRNPGGDCFACALTAALRWIYQKPDIAFDVCWDFFMVETAGGGRALSNTWLGMRSALFAASSAFWQEGHLEIIADIAAPEFDVHTWSHTWGAHITAHAYAHRLEGWLRSGFVAFSEIDYAGRGPVVDGKWNTHDHFVLIDGIRLYWKPHEVVDGVSCAEEDVHVVCSAKGAYWISLREFLFKHGAGGWWLARKDGRR